METLDQSLNNFDSNSDSTPKAINSTEKKNFKYMIEETVLQKPANNEKKKNDIILTCKLSVEKAKAFNHKRATATLEKIQSVRKINLVDYDYDDDDDDDDANDNDDDDDDEDEDEDVDQYEGEQKPESETSNSTQHRNTNEYKANEKHDANVNIAKCNVEEGTLIENVVSENITKSHLNECSTLTSTKSEPKVAHNETTRTEATLEKDQLAAVKSTIAVETAIFNVANMFDDCKEDGETNETNENCSYNIANSKTNEEIVEERIRMCPNEPDTEVQSNKVVNSDDTQFERDQVEKDAESFKVTERRDSPEYSIDKCEVSQKSNSLRKPNDNENVAKINGDHKTHEEYVKYSEAVEVEDDGETVRQTELQQENNAVIDKDDNDGDEEHIHENFNKNNSSIDIEKEENCHCSEVRHTETNTDIGQRRRSSSNTTTTSRILATQNEDSSCSTLSSSNGIQQPLPLTSTATTSFSDQLQSTIVSEENSQTISMQDENEISRCSTVNSSPASNTSSSHQLVIDHPMDDNGDNSKLATLKTAVKRKLSHSSADDVIHVAKQQYLDGSLAAAASNDESDESLEEKPNYFPMVSSFISNSISDGETVAPSDCSKQHITQEEADIYNKHCEEDRTQEITEEVTTSDKSLLLERLQQPLLPTTTNVSESTQNKYMCFNCNGLSFDTHQMLSEHQISCISNNILKERLSISLKETQNTDELATSPPLPTQQTAETELVTCIEKKRYFKCTMCKSFHDSWNFFLHVRDKHNRYICLYCTRFFPTSEKLSLHMENKHDIEQNHFNSEIAYRESLKQSEAKGTTRCLICCTCQYMFQEHEPFTDHICNEYMQPCALCGQKGRHTNDCKNNTNKRDTKAKKARQKAKKNATLLSNATDVVNEQLPLSVNEQTHPHPQQSQPQPQQQQYHQYLPQPQIEPADSEDSSNMIIDESCNTSHSQTAFNKLTTLDKSERQTDLTTMASTSMHPPHVSKLVVPKLKLRVPKEFQKSVDAAISSTDSEDGSEEDDAAETDVGVVQVDENNCVTKNTNYESSRPLMDQGKTPRPVDVENMESNSTAETTAEKPFVPPTSVAVHRRLTDEDSVDTNIVRIMDEIERTKLDIERTKQSMLSAHSAHEPKTATMTEERNNIRVGPADHSWSPTPPASPNSRWFTPRRPIISQDESVASGIDTNNAFSNSDILAKDIQLKELQTQSIQATTRRDTVGSDAMDIDDTIAVNVQSVQPYVTDPRSEQQNSATESLINVNAPNFNNAASLETIDSDVTPAQLPTSIAESQETIEKSNDDEIDVCAPSTLVEQEESVASLHAIQSPPTPTPTVPADGIEVANDDALVTDLQLDRPLEKFETIEFVRLCLKAVYPFCLYCNHARRIAVNGRSLVLHMIAQHRFTATVDSITAEELQSDTIVAKLKSFLSQLETEYLNSSSFCTVGDGAFTRHFNERIYECFQCRFVTSTHKELYLHNRKMHIKTAILCFMCRANFFSFSEILCHICPGMPNKTAIFDVKYRCCLCDLTNIPSPFRLMVHLRKRHFACDVCLEDCRDQSKLSSHVWKHKLHHLCYRCGIAYRNKLDITKHLFWKHGTESINCKRCLQKRWRHVYHFCVPPPTFTCDVCNLCFSKAMFLNVHKRVHTGDYRYPCTEENCEEKFVSRRLLLKHAITHQTSIEDVQECKSVELKAEPLSRTDEDNDKDTKIEEIKEDVKQESEKLVESIENSTTSVPLCENQQADDVASPIVPGSASADNENTTEKDGKSDLEKPRKKRKKEKRSKESLEDLNLIAPNLSESDSSDDSDTDAKSKSEEETPIFVPKVMLSPTSESDNEQAAPSDDQKTNVFVTNEDKMPEIWKNLLQAQRAGSLSPHDEKIASAVNNEVNYTELNFPNPDKLHVANSDHDYCAMYQTRKPSATTASSKRLSNKSTARKTTKSPRRGSAKRSDDDSSDDTSSESGSSTDSSCSCGPNCSCSSSASGSSSSSSSSDSESSGGSNVSPSKRTRKKSERKKSQSASPLKQAQRQRHNSETINVIDEQETAVNNTSDEKRPPSPPTAPIFYESDFETAESDTDEEFYDEHPQKLASELLAQKRAQLMAQTRLSPSHNYDIVENSRPSTPSLPEDMSAYGEKRVKLKKKKRERKSSCRSAANQQPGKMPTINVVQHINQDEQIQTTTEQLHKGTNFNSAYLAPNRMFEPPLHVAVPPSPQLNNSVIYANATLLPTPELQHMPRNDAPHSMLATRMSEGSSCSDADSSLKRSKRARRPNKFYGYTSDDENMGIIQQQPLMIGMQCIKPTPPPQLTWCKEDLPTPPKTFHKNKVLNNKHKVPRLPKTPTTPLVGGLFNNTNQTAISTSTKRKNKRTVSPDKPTRKRSSKKKEMETTTVAALPVEGASSLNLPPIPPLKIRPSQITGTNHIHASQMYPCGKESDDDDDDDSTSDSDSSESDNHIIMTKPRTSVLPPNVWSTTLNAAASTTIPPALQQQSVQETLSPLAQPNTQHQPLPSEYHERPKLPMLPPVPEATVFKQKIPPALLPNPDFATLQYFKANNIRYPIRPPAGARQPRDGEAVYCYCRCPYDEVSEMIACDGDNCLIEWFHFECVGIMVAPQGKWFCAECRPKYSEELYPTNRV